MVDSLFDGYLKDESGHAWWRLQINNRLRRDRQLWDIVTNDRS